MYARNYAMTSRALDKFEQWATKIEENIKHSTNNPKSIRELCYSSRRLIEWSYKLQEKQLSDYAKIVNRKTDLFLTAGDAIYNHYLNRLVTVRDKTKLGSAARINALWQMLYYTQAYVLPCYAECDAKERVTEAIKMILHDIAPEFPSYAEAKRNHLWLTGAKRLHKMLIALKQEGHDVYESLITKFSEPSASVFQPYA